MRDFVPSYTDLGPDPEPPGVQTDYLLERSANEQPGPARRHAGARDRPLEVVIAGGGPAAIEAALALRTLAPHAARVRLLAPEPSFVYRPLSVVEPFAAGQVREYSLDRLAARGVKVIADSLAAVDPDARTLVTGSGTLLSYDALVVATGASARREFSHATTFTGPADSEAVHGIVQDLEGGWCKRIAFVAPVGANWTLPLYELALQTAERARDLCLDDVEITLITHERCPLGHFGPGAAASVSALLRESGVHVVTWARPSVPRAGLVETGTRTQAIEADRIVALPVPVGRSIAGLPSDDRGFLPVDRLGRVEDVEGVYAAGDGTSHPIKQGGLATQQADIAVAAVLADAGLRAAPNARQPVLRAMLIAGERTLYLRREGADPSSGVASPRPLWWPPAKIAGHYLAPFLDEIDAEQPVTRLERRRATRNGAVRRRAIIGRVAEDTEHALIALVENGRE
jgi:sulfide:quinone oxidoreductase